MAVYTSRSTLNQKAGFSDSMGVNIQKHDGLCFIQNHLNVILCKNSILVRYNMYIGKNKIISWPIEYMDYFISVVDNLNTEEKYPVILIIQSRAVVHEYPGNV